MEQQKLQNLLRVTLDTVEHASLVKAIVDMASAFKLKVIAEGIETANQNNYLKSIKCGFAQGFLHSKPLSTDGFLLLLTEQNQLNNSQEQILSCNVDTFMRYGQKKA